ncbi:MAG: hypothetical protein V1867_03505 [Candidatus Falkowbacteria bacterium]
MNKKEKFTDLFSGASLDETKRGQRKINNLLNRINEIKNKSYQEIEGSDDQEEIDECYLEIKKAINELLPVDYRLEEVEVGTDGLLWRGSNPVELLSLLADKNNILKIESKKPNVATRWETSIAYAGDTKNMVSALPFNMAIGFWKDNINIVNPKDGYTNDAQYYRVVNGDINMGDIKAVALRLHGKEPGKPYYPKIFQIKKVSAGDLEKKAA